MRVKDPENVRFYTEVDEIERDDTESKANRRGKIERDRLCEDEITERKRMLYTCGMEYKYVWGCEWRMFNTCKRVKVG